MLGGLLLLASALADAQTQTQPQTQPQTQIQPPPKVVVSVLPVHSLVAALMHGVGDPRLLMPAGQSPHTSALKPSQAAALERADLIVWIGPRFEPSVGKLIAQRPATGSARVLTLLAHHDITLLGGNRDAESGAHYGHSHGEHDPGGVDLSPPRATPLASAHDPWGVDPHIWLSFANARAIARIVSGELARLDPANRARYAANARGLLARLAALQQSLGETLGAVAEAPYIVFHDAYRYFEGEFGLRPVASLTISAERPPGAARIRALRKIIHDRKVRCVFREPQFRADLVDTLIAGTDATTGVLDPLGVGLEAGPTAWFELMQGLGDALTTCLSRAAR